MDSKEALKYIQEADRALDDGRIDDAIRISGEALAKADNDWAAAVNSGSPDPLLFWIAAELARTHCMLLVRAGMLDQAFSVASMMICQIIEREIPVLGQEDCVMILLLILANSSTEYCRSMAEDPSIDETSQHHAMILACETCSMLYAAYRKWAKGLEPGIGNFFYEQLQQILAERLVVYPTIEVDGLILHPDDIAETIGDAIGRAMAIGLFRIEE